MIEYTVFGVREHHAKQSTEKKDRMQWGMYWEGRKQTTQTSHQLYDLADWNRGTVLCAQWQDSIHRLLHQTADVEQPANRHTSCYEIGGRGSWNPASRVWPTVALLAFAESLAHWDWPYKDNDEEVGLRWKHAVSQLRLWWTVNNGPPSLLPATWWALHPGRSHHRHKAAQCVKDTREVA